MKLDELRARLRAVEAKPELEKPPIGRIPYCAGCMKRLDKCEHLDTCKGFLPKFKAEALDVGQEMIERMRSRLGPEDACDVCGVGAAVVDRYIDTPTGSNHVWLCRACDDVLQAP